MKKTKAVVGRLVPDCPCCKDFAEGRDAHAGKVTVFTWKGVCHAAPSMWLAGALLGPNRTPMQDALAFWAWHCSVEIEQGRAA